MSDISFNKDRRSALRMLVGSIASIPVVDLLIIEQAYAADLPHVSEDDPTVKALRYVHDATKAARSDTGETPADQQFCKNCNFVLAEEGEWRPCGLFPGKAVNQNGWCISWIVKTT